MGISPIWSNDCPLYIFIHPLILSDPIILLVVERAHQPHKHAGCNLNYSMHAWPIILKSFCAWKLPSRFPQYKLVTLIGLKMDHLEGPQTSRELSNSYFPIYSKVSFFFWPFNWKLWHGRLVFLYTWKEIFLFRIQINLPLTDHFSYHSQRRPINEIILTRALVEENCHPVKWL